MTYIIESVFFACVACCFIKFMAREAAGSGIPEMKSILSGVHLPRFLDFRTLVAKFFGLAAVFMAGIPIGKEGPMVHIGSCVAELLMRHVPLFAKVYRSEFVRYQILSVGCAIGIATTFGSPFGGVLFALETTATYFLVSNLWKGILCTTSGAVLFFILKNIADHDQMLNLLPAYIPPKPYEQQELLLFAFLGLCGGLLGVGIVLTMRQFLRIRRIWSPIKESIFGITIFATIACALLTYPFVFMRGTTQPEFISAMLANHLPAEYLDPNKFLNLGILFVVQFFLVTLCVSLPIPLGVSRPASLLGAIMGRMIGEFMMDYFPWYSTAITPSTYALVGATACVASTARTLSTAVVIFESTGHLEMLLPVCVAVTIAYLVGNVFVLSCYDTVIELRNLPLMTEPQPSKQFSRGIATDVMIRHPDIYFLTLKSTFRDVERLLTSSQHFSYPVVVSDVDMTLVGLVQRFHLENMIEEFQNLHLDGKAKLERIQYVEGQIQSYVWETFRPLDSVEVPSTSAEEMVVDPSFSGRSVPRSVVDKALTGPKLETTDEVVESQHSLMNSEEQKDDVERGLQTNAKDEEEVALDRTIQIQFEREFRVLQYLRENRYLSSKRTIDVRCGVPIDLAPFVMSERSPLYKMHFAFAMMGVSHALIVSAGKLIGVVTKKDLLSFMKAKK
eukprot:ANDGO_03277.mRNA.1 Chloride channel protein E